MCVRACVCACVVICNRVKCFVDLHCTCVVAVEDGASGGTEGG